MGFKRLHKDALGSVGIGIVALGYLYEARKLPFGSIQRPESGFVPFILGVVLLGLAVILFLGALMSYQDTKGKGINSGGNLDEESITQAVREKKSRMVRVGILVGLLLLYPLILLRLGFLFTTILFLYGSLRVMGHDNKLIAGGISCIMSFLAKFVFEQLGVYFPTGVLW